jgi:hypothetical protein
VQPASTTASADAGVPASVVIAAGTAPFSPAPAAHSSAGRPIGGRGRSPAELTATGRRRERTRVRSRARHPDGDPAIPRASSGPRRARAIGRLDRCHLAHDRRPDAEPAIASVATATTSPGTRSPCETAVEDGPHLGVARPPRRRTAA